eukprot:XP_001699603.1 predicted protein [Chlamydomonas reinhardtii]
MTRKDTEDLIKQLKEAAECQGPGEQALDNRPSLIKKLNEKIIKLESDLEVLRDQTRVNELEKKVQRLEGELQRSYATKNFTLKNGLLEIEKAYRDFISSSAPVQNLSVGCDSPARPPAGPEGGELAPPPTSFVQQQVDKFKDYTFTPGLLDPHDPNHPANQHHNYPHPHYFPAVPNQAAADALGFGYEADARAGEAHDDRPPLGAVDPAALRGQRCGACSAAYDWAPSPLQPGAAASSSDPHAASSSQPSSDPHQPQHPQHAQHAQQQRAPRAVPDASAFASMADQLEVSVARLREYFGAMRWAPGGPVAAGLAAATAGGGGGAPDARYFDSQADAILSSVEIVFGGASTLGTGGAVAGNHGAAGGVIAAGTPTTAGGGSAVRFRINVNASEAGTGTGNGTPADRSAQVRHSLSEQLASTQELVMHLNKQLKGALEAREDAAAAEARGESHEFMRDLVETKVLLAEVQASTCRCTRLSSARSATRRCGREPCICAAYQPAGWL